MKSLRESWAKFKVDFEEEFDRQMLDWYKLREKVCEKIRNARRH